MLKNLFVGFVVLVIVTLIVLVGVSCFNYVRSPVVEDYAKFAKNFDKESHEPVDLSRGTGISLIGDEISYFKSSLFPYFGLEDLLESYQLDPECGFSDDLVLYKDNIWQVFWVGKFNCKSYITNVKLYGPFRSKKPLPSY